MRNKKKPKLQIKQKTEVDRYYLTEANELDQHKIEAEIKGFEMLITHFKEEYRHTMSQIEIIKNSVFVALAVYITFLGFFYAIKFADNRFINYFQIYTSNLITFVLISFSIYILHTKPDFMANKFHQDIRENMFSKPKQEYHPSKLWQIYDNILSKYKNMHEENNIGLGMLLARRDKFAILLLVSFLILIFFITFSNFLIIFNFNTK